MLGYGLLPTPRDVIPWGEFGAAADVSVPDECLRLSEFVRRGGNQSITSSCVWWAIAGAIFATMGMRGWSPFWPSVLAGYWATRRSSAYGGDIADTGCRTVTAADVVRAMGLVPDASWPFVVSRVDDEPDFGALILAPDHEWFALRRITALGGDRSQAVRVALSAPGAEARYIVRGQALDHEAQLWTPDRGPYSRGGRPIVGRHAELLAGYTREGVVAVSSWGRDDRIDSWDQLESDDTTDVWAVEFDPRGVL